MLLFEQLPSRHMSQSLHDPQSGKEQPATPARKPWFTIHKAVFCLIVLLVIKALVAPAAPQRPTIEDWISKAAKVAPEAYLRAGHLYVEAASLNTTVGEPDEIQFLSQRVYMTWRCRDGRVQAVVDRHTLKFGQYLVGEVNYSRD